MSKSGKAGVIVFFLFSIGAVISSLRVIGYIEEKQKEREGLITSVEELTISLEERSAELAERSAELAERSAELARVGEEKRVLEEELRRERELKEGVQRKLNQRSAELVRVREEKRVLEEALRREKELREEMQRELSQKIEELRLLEARLKELPPQVEEQVIEVPPQELPPALLQRIEGRIMVVTEPFLSLELDEEVVEGLQPTLSIYRRGRLIKELAAKKIRGAVLIARVSPGDLEGVREGDQVSLGLPPGAPGIFGLPHLEGEVLDVISPGFLNIALGREGLGDIQPTLLIYRDGEPFREIELKDLDRLTISVEVVEETDIRGIRRRDIVKLIP